MSKLHILPSLDSELMGVSPHGCGARRGGDSRLRDQWRRQRIRCDDYGGSDYVFPPRCALPRRSLQACRCPCPLPDPQPEDGDEHRDSGGRRDPTVCESQADQGASRLDVCGVGKKKDQEQTVSLALASKRNDRLVMLTMSLHSRQRAPPASGPRLRRSYIHITEREMNMEEKLMSQQHQWKMHLRSLKNIQRIIQ